MTSLLGMWLEATAWHCIMLISQLSTLPKLPKPAGACSFLKRFSYTYKYLMRRNYSQSWISWFERGRSLIATAATSTQRLLCTWSPRRRLLWTGAKMRMQPHALKAAIENYSTRGILTSCLRIDLDHKNRPWQSYSFSIPQMSLTPLAVSDFVTVLQ